MDLPDDVRLSVPRMDREHAEILQAAAELRFALNSSLQNTQLLTRLLDEFAEAAAGHFASEEDMMQAGGYQGWRAHASEHKRLLEQIIDVKTGFAAGAINPCGTLALFVEVWTTQHIQRSDRHFAEFVKSQEFENPSQEFQNA